MIIYDYLYYIGTGAVWEGLFLKKKGTLVAKGMKSFYGGKGHRLRNSISFPEECPMGILPCISICIKRFYQKDTA